MSVEMHGFCEPAFAAPVAEAFERGFAARGPRRELGAAVAVHANGGLVVDLWGGLADPFAGTPWREDTIAHGTPCRNRSWRRAPSSSPIVARSSSTQSGEDALEGALSRRALEG